MSVVVVLAALSFAGYAFVIIAVLRRRAAKRRREEFVAPPVPATRVAAVTAPRVSVEHVERAGGARARLLDALDGADSPGPAAEAPEPAGNVIPLDADRARGAGR